MSACLPRSRTVKSFGSSFSLHVVPMYCLLPQLHNFTSPLAMDRVQFLHTLTHTGFLILSSIHSNGYEVASHSDIECLFMCFLTVSVTSCGKVFSSLLSIFKIVFLKLDYLYNAGYDALIKFVIYKFISYSEITSFFCPLVYRTFLKIYSFIFYVHECFPTYMYVCHICVMQRTFNFL